MPCSRCAGASSSVVSRAVAGGLGRWCCWSWQRVILSVRDAMGQGRMAGLLRVTAMACRSAREGPQAARDWLAGWMAAAR